MREKAAVLKQYMERWLSQHQARTLSALSQQCGVPFQTLRKLYLGEAEPIFDHALVLLGVTATREEMLGYMEQYHAGSFAFMREVESEKTFRDLDLADELARGKITFWITAFALTGHAYQGELVQFFGRKAAAEIERLEGAGLIEVAPDGGISLKKMPGFLSSYDKRFLFTMIRHFLELSDELSEERSQKHPYAFFGNVSSEGRREIEELLKEAAIKVSKIIHNQEGDELVAVSLMDLSFKELTR